MPKRKILAACGVIAALATAALAPTPAIAATGEGVVGPELLNIDEYPTFFGGYRTVEAYEGFVADLASAYPDLVEAVDYGDSWLKTTEQGGHDLLAVRITADVADQPALGSDKEHRPRFVLATQIHAREIVTSELAWRYATELVDGYGVDPRTTALLDTTEVWIAFQTNPDGVDLVQEGLSGSASVSSVVPEEASSAWQRKNVDDTEFVAVPDGADPSSMFVTLRQAGVDLNRNYATAWEDTELDPAEETYEGPSAASEPETQAQVTLMTDLFGVHPVAPGDPPQQDRTGTFVSLHTCQGVVAYPYSYTATTPAPDDAAMRASAFRQSFVSGYRAGPVGEVIYESHGTQTDWAYEALGIPAYTYEVGVCDESLFFPSFDRTPAFYDEVAPGIRFAASTATAPYTASLGGVITSVAAELQPDGSVRITGTATDEAYGPSTMVQAPAATAITEVEAAIAPTLASVAGTVPMTIAAAGTTVDFTGEISAKVAASAGSVFVRAKNGTGQWGPWTAPTADGILAPRLASPTTVTLTAGERSEVMFETLAQADVTVSIADGALPSGLLQGPDGGLSGTTDEVGQTNVTIRLTLPSGASTDVPLTIEVLPAPLSPMTIVWFIAGALAVVIGAIIIVLIARRVRRG